MSPKNPWKILEDNYNYANVTEKTSREVAQIFGCEGKSDKEIVLCMRARPLSDIMTLYSVRTIYIISQLILQKLK